VHEEGGDRWRQEVVSVFIQRQSLKKEGHDVVIKPLARLEEIEILLVYLLVAKLGMDNWSGHLRKAPRGSL
jgi:hypothetical protein